MRTLLSRVVALFRRRLDDRLDDEVRAHLELLAADCERRGMSAAEARRAARRAFGGVEQMKETYRDRRGLPWFETLRQDVRDAWRQLARNPSFAITVIVTLALCIGASTAVFTVVDAVLVRPLPYPEPARLMAVHERVEPFGRIPVSDMHFREWRQSSRTLDGLALVWGQSVNLSGSVEPERVAAARVSPDLFRILGVRPQLGRLLRDEEDRPGRDRVVLLSDELWRRRFGADPRVVGQTVAIDGDAHEVVGVLPRGFGFPRLNHLYSIPVQPSRPEIWKPLALAADDSFLGGFNFAAIARLKPGVSPQQAETDINAVLGALPKPPGAGPFANARAELTPLQQQITSRSRRGLEVMLAAVVAVLLIACVNVAGILFARSLVRQREAAVRSALGATRGRLVRQFVTEAAVLVGLGSAVGAAVAVVFVRLLVVTAPVSIPQLSDVTLGIRVGLFVAAAAVVSALVVGLLPAWRLARASLYESLRTGGQRGTGDRRTRRLQASLVTAEAGLTSGCLVVAGLLLHSFVNLMSVDKGFETANLVTAGVTLAGERYASPERVVALQRGLVDTLTAAPGVAAVAVSNHELLSGFGPNLRVAAEDPAVPLLERPLAQFRGVNSAYFRTFGISLREGSTFADGETRRIALVSEALARRLWPGENAIGKRIRRGPETVPFMEVIGTVADVRGTRLEDQPPFTVYEPYWQFPLPQLSVAVSTPLEPGIFGTVLQDAVRDLDPTVPIGPVRTMDEVVIDSVAERRFLTILVFVFASAGVLLAGSGVWGVVSQGVAQRRGEIGVRLALGERPASVRRMIIRDAWKMAAIGVAIGIPGALAMGSVFRSLLFEVVPHDAATLAGASVALLGVATVAAFVPARRASRLDPVVVLRTE